MKMKPAATYELLVDGIGQWDFTGNFVPCELLLTGDAAFPVLVSPEKQVLIAVSHYGKGRMVVVSHEEILKNPNFSQFLRNAVDWLRPSPEAQVGVHRSLDPLSQLLLRSSTKVQPGVGLSASLGVYCTDAYDDAQAEELVHFVKGGGGLLMGGQAWYWASQQSAEKVLFEFPGNQVTSVAGVYFTGNTVGSGIFKVSGKIPKIPLIVPHGANLSQDAELLLKGVSELDIVTGGVPSQLLVHGVLAFPLGLDSSHRCFLAAARYGRGRVVVASHEGQLCAPKLAGFLLNAINWLDAGRQGLVGVAAHLKGLCSLLSQEDWKYQVSALTSNMSVYCCPSHSDQEAEKIQAFVAEGGGLLIGGQAWYWSSQNQGQAAVAGYPGNKILNRFGISILGMNLKADKYPALLPGELPHHYHFRQALSLFQRHVGDKEEALRAPLADWLHRLGQDCSAFLRIPAEDCPAYSSLHRILLKVLHRGGIPQVSKKNPIKSNSKEAALLCLATQLSQTMTDCAVLVQKPTDGVCTLPSSSLITLEIDGTNTGERSGLFTFPICQKQSVSCLWGGLIYIVVPGGSQLGKVPITVEGAVQAPYFRLGETCKCQWLASIRHYPAPWAELATENIILTVSADSIRHIENPEPLLTLWDQIMMAIAELAAAPAKFPRPERIVTDVQISAGWMHAGYPIMGHLDSVKEMVNVEHMRATGLWGPIHELGHNQQRAGWEFPPHTTEATCNLWSVYVHEKVLGIPRDRAHQALQPQCRKQRITGYLEKGAQLKDWSVWTALETYLQLQEGFGWEPFILLFSDYQKMSNIPKDNPSKMNLWAEKFSRQVNKNLAPFFLAWGWPIKEDVSLELATLPNWEENPMKLYRPGKK
uniref:Peptidase M60 domain-containing protein n=1 Tax=Gopherus evgoodei TaxID=1825980 RepID=A0A8C4XWU1_9SAUR